MVASHNTAGFTWTFLFSFQVKNDEKLDTRRAVTVVETIISHFSERKFLVTEYYTHWKVHISTGKEFKVQWHQFVQDARKVGGGGSNSRQGFSRRM